MNTTGNQSISGTITPAEHPSLMPVVALDKRIFACSSDMEDGAANEQLQLESYLQHSKYMYNKEI